MGELKTVIDEKLMRCFMEIAERMISAGAEVYRVEESLGYMCKAYGAVRSDAYVTPSNMTFNVEREDGTVLFEGRRVKPAGFDIERIDRLNSLIRYITNEHPSVEVIEQKLAEAENYKKYKLWQNVLFSLLVAGSFTVFFGSRDLVEIAASSVIGGIVGIIDHFSKKINMNGIMVRFICSAFSSFLAFMAVKMGLAPNPDYIIIGNIMTLIPGCGITNALRDLFTGDTFTGIQRTIEAILYAGSMALGYIAVAYLLGGVI